MVMIFVVIATVYAALTIILFLQAWRLSRIFRSTAWTFLAAGFGFLGLRQVWAITRMPAALRRAVARGVLIENIAAEQWILVALAFLAAGCLIVGMDRLRSDLRRIGV